MAAHGDGRWNGVAILSPRRARRRHARPARAAGVRRASWSRARSARPAAACGSGRVYVPNGRTVDDPHYAYKLEWLAALRDAAVGRAGRAPEPLAILGDFNVAPTDADVWDIAKFADSTHVTAAERAALAALADAGLVDVMPRALKCEPLHLLGLPPAAFPKNTGMRIDLVYANAVVRRRPSPTPTSTARRASPAKGNAAQRPRPVVVDVDAVARRDRTVPDVGSCLVTPAPLTVRRITADEHLAYVRARSGRPVSFLQLPAWGEVKAEWRTRVARLVRRRDELVGAGLVLLPPGAAGQALPRLPARGPGHRLDRRAHRPRPRRLAHAAARAPAGAGRLRGEDGPAGRRPPLGRRHAQGGDRRRAAPQRLRDVAPD